MKNFFDTKDEKITEKAFTQSLVVSVVGILICIVALCSTTYAWFTGSVSNASNTLSAGAFALGVQVTSGEGEATAADEGVEMVLENEKYVLKSPDTYTVQLIPTGETTVKGYCVVRINGTSYYTPVIVNDATKSEDYPSPNAPFTFKITTYSPNVTVDFEAHWGVSAAEEKIDPSVPIVIGAATAEENGNG